MIRFSGRWGGSGRPLTPEIDVGWSLGMPEAIFDVPSDLPNDLWPIIDPLHRHWIIEVPQSRQEEHPRNMRKMRKMMDF